MDRRSGGYAGKILDVTLDPFGVRVRPLDEGTACDYLGGRGLGARLLYDAVPPTADPLGPENVLILTTGPLTGTLFPTGDRIVATARSPLTGIYGAALAGGHFAPELKFAGFDAVLIRGAAREPSYLLIEDGQAELRPAGHLWGKLTDATETALRREARSDKAAVMSIGPAGERLVRYACLIVDGRAAGRCGLGAVMGSKRLKAVVARGSGGVRLARPREFGTLCLELFRNFAASPGMQAFGRIGTLGTVDTVNAFGIFPTRNFRQGVFEGAGQMHGDHFRANYVVRDTACMACPVACTKVARVRTGEYAGAWSEGPEYETVYALGANCGNGDMGAVIRGDRLCDLLGLDTMSAGCSIAFAMECVERGLLSRADLGDLDLRFGNHRALLQALHLIATREGIGDLLAEGVKRMAERIGQGSEAFAIHVKGLELGGYDPRGLQGEGLSMATAERGGCHHFGGYVVMTETSGKVDNLATAGKGKLVRETRMRTVINDSITHCSFVARGPGMEETTLATALQYATGWAFSVDRLRRIAERIMNLERCFNARVGVRREHDTLPERLQREGLTAGPFQGSTVNLPPMLDEFYEAMGWDPATGIPTGATLSALGLNREAADLAGVKP
ncbi:MAG: aldehyde ferredoxin oxidoreductase family protein [candidate division NC10 bacterium]|nr:aldehyde ferredoxin oxidoreductase family protein [candidate division NC10 bacterium]